jgi:hypothetical protein
VSAADSPEDAVYQLFDAVERGDRDAMGALVCEAERAGVREMLDPSGSLGVDAAGLAFVVDDLGVELIDRSEDEATAFVSGSLSLDLAEDEIEAFARAMLAADSDGEPSAEDLAMVLPLMEMVSSQTFALDREVTLVVEDDEWVVCGGLVDEPEEPDFGLEPSVSEEGLCGLVRPEELSALSELSYDSSNGYGGTCSYSNSDYDAYHSASVTIEVNADAEWYAQAYGADQRLEVAGARAWAGGAESYGNTLLTQVGNDIIMVNITLPEDVSDGLDWLDQATLVTELVLTRLDEAREMIAGPMPPPTPEPTPEVSLCETLSLEEINELTGLGFDAATGNPGSCYYEQLDGEPGFHVATFTLVDLPMDDYAGFLPDLEETAIGELRAAAMEGTLLVDLPGGTHTLQVGGFVDAADESAALTSEELLRVIAERVAPAIVLPEAAAETAADTAAGPSLCDVVDLDVLNETTGLGLDAMSGSDDSCELMSTDGVPGGHYVIAVRNEVGLDAYRSMGAFEDGSVAGRPALIGEGWVVVESLDGSQVLDVVVGLDAGDSSLALTETEAAAAVAEHMLPGLAGS